MSYKKIRTACHKIFKQGYLNWILQPTQFQLNYLANAIEVINTFKKTTKYLLSDFNHCSHETDIIMLTGLREP